MAEIIPESRALVSFETAASDAATARSTPRGPLAPPG